MHIVVAAKPDADQPWVAEAVANLCQQTSATVAVMAADEVELERLAGVPRSVFTQQAEQSAATMARWLTERGVQASHTVRPGRALQAIREFAEEQNADLIVVGSSSRPAVTERLLGSVPLDLIKKSSRPVLVITHPGQSTP